MLQIDHTIISFDVLEKRFVCDLKKCMGACCVYGDAGAPLETEEINLLKEHLDDIKPFLSKEGIASIETNGIYYIDVDGDQVTSLINEHECAFTVFEEGVATCGIEKAYEAGKIKFQKPVSCHLYPIRIDKYKDFEAVNYHKWDVCKEACKLGNKLDIPVYVFLKEPLIRKYGKDWYDQLDYAAKHLLLEEQNQRNR